MDIHHTELPIPSFFAPFQVKDVFRVPYQERAQQARDWARKHQIEPSAEDQKRICLLLVDAQLSFCNRDFELFVAGSSGRGAIEDMVRICSFIYRNLKRITTLVVTLDTHLVFQIFHQDFWINDKGEHPAPASGISLSDIEAGIWKVNPKVAQALASEVGSVDELQQYALHYARRLACGKKYPLIVWPYHAMLGSISHALVPSVAEACFFHAVSRSSQTVFESKGGNPLTENYSVLAPEVQEAEDGKVIEARNTSLEERLLDFDMIIIAGEAKSHCVAWTVRDLLDQIQARDATFAEKVYLLEDCTSPVVVPGGPDFSEMADELFAEFSQAGVHLVKSTTPMSEWP